MFVLVALAAAFVARLRSDWSRIAVRVAGSWIVACGSLYARLGDNFIHDGRAGVLIRRNAIIIFMSVEFVMLNAANLAFVAFARSYNVLSGQLFVFFVMTVSAAEAWRWAWR